MKKIQNIKYEKYGPFWCVVANGEMLGVTLYKKGAETIAEIIAGLAGIEVTIDLPKPRGKAKATKVEEEPEAKPKPKAKAKKKTVVKVKPAAKAEPQPEPQPQVEQTSLIEQAGS